MSTSKPASRHVTIQDAAEQLSVDPKTIRRYIGQGRLKAVRVGPRLIRNERGSLESLGKPVGGAQ
jgi:excisionase family DNA binding protein